MQSDSIPETRFSELDLPDALLDALEDLEFEHCTTIQALSLPPIIAGEDVAAQAQTGTGKTAAYLLGAFTRLLRSTEPEGRRPNQPLMVAIAPTRELAIQIKKDADALARYTDLRIRLVYGGVDYEKQARELSAGVDVLIGTPGRLIDYYKRKVYDMKHVDVLVLDEADRMFDLGFIADIRYLMRHMPEPGIRASMLFSATLSNRVMELAYEHMNNPTTLKTETSSVTAEGIEQTLFHPSKDEKIALLIGLVRELEPHRTIVFVNTKRAAELIESYLLGNGISCGTLSGDVRQSRRQKILSDFTEGAIPLLIATDVAARGLHIDGVTHVFNFDLPQQAEDYVHRIGRTARAGSTGEAISFACEEYSFSLPEIQQYIGQEIPFAPITDDLIVDLAPRKRMPKKDSVGPRPRRQGGRSGNDNRRPRRH